MRQKASASTPALTCISIIKILQDEKIENPIAF
jgi:hypothetical protein